MKTTMKMENKKGGGSFVPRPTIDPLSTIAS
jgi:hypothetical protein